jgi:hypothetical protein
MDAPDTCNPNLKLKFQTYKIYSIIIPMLLMALVLEVIFIFMSIPTSIGNALTTAGPFPTSKVPLIK